MLGNESPPYSDERAVGLVWGVGGGSGHVQQCSFPPRLLTQLLRRIVSADLRKKVAQLSFPSHQALGGCVQSPQCPSTLYLTDPARAPGQFLLPPLHFTAAKTEAGRDIHCCTCFTCYITRIL